MALFQEMQNRLVDSLSERQPETPPKATLFRKMLDRVNKYLDPYILKEAATGMAKDIVALPGQMLGMRTGGGAIYENEPGYLERIGEYLIEPVESKYPYMMNVSKEGMTPRIQEGLADIANAYMLWQMIPALQGGIAQSRYNVATDRVFNTLAKNKLIPEGTEASLAPEISQAIYNRLFTRPSNIIPMYSGVPMVPEGKAPNMANLSSKPSNLPLINIGITPSTYQKEGILSYDQYRNKLSREVRMGTITEMQKQQSLMNWMTQHGRSQTYGEMTPRQIGQQLLQTQKDSIIRSNSDPHYLVTIDPDTICPKTEKFSEAVLETQKKLGRKLSSEEWHALRLEKKGRGEVVPCPQCYTEEGRIAGAMANKIKETGTYNRGDIQRKLMNKVDILNAHAGLRYFSNTDYKPKHLEMLKNTVRDASEIGLSGHAYTKQKEFAEIFAPTSMKINMSIAGDIGKNNTLRENTDMGMPWSDAFEMRNIHPTVGTVFIAKSDKEVHAALDHPMIDHIIPVHLRQKLDIAKKYWGAEKSFTREQHETWLDPNNTSKVPKRYDSMFGGDKKKYLDWCAGNGLRPAFPNFVSHPNYMKLISPEAGKFGDNSVVPMKPIFGISKPK